MRLSKHFTLAEFIKSRTARIHGIDNTPKPEDLENLKRLAKVMEKVRTAHGDVPITPDSVYRSDELNVRVGGVAGSRHTRGLAIDFTVPGYTPADTVKIIKSIGIKFHKVINEYDEWVHLSIPAKDEKAKKIALKRDVGGYHVV